MRILKIRDKNFPYTLKRRRGMRCMRLSINSAGSFVVSAPRWYPMMLINRFLEEKAEWIWEKLKHIDFDLMMEKSKNDAINYQSQKKIARKIILERLKFWNQHYNFAYKRVSIKNQKTCWGSCSQKGNLNFNYKIISLEERLRDYIIVHELCHLQELNHGERFWKLVAENFPDYKQIRKKINPVARER